MKNIWYLQNGCFWALLFSKLYQIYLLSQEVSNAILVILYNLPYSNFALKRIQCNHVGNYEMNIKIGTFVVCICVSERLMEQYNSWAFTRRNTDSCKLNFLMAQVNDFGIRCFNIHSESLVLHLHLKWWIRNIKFQLSETIKMGIIFLCLSWNKEDVAFNYERELSEDVIEYVEIWLIWKDGAKYAIVAVIESSYYLHKHSH